MFVFQWKENLKKYVVEVLHRGGIEPKRLLVRTVRLARDPPELLQGIQID